MKKNEKQLHVGKVMDAHGIRGDIYCLLFSGDASWAEDLLHLNLHQNNQNRQFEIKKIKPFKKGFIATLKEVSDRNRAEALKGAEIWVDESLFVAEPGESLYLREVMGFQVYGVASKLIGTVESFSTNGSQDLLVVRSADDRTVEIPFVQDFVTDIDYEKKQIHMDLPEGLLEINDGD